MKEYGYLVSVAIIMISTKLLGDLTEKVRMPQVVGALAAGILVGPSVFGLIEESQFIAYTAEIGVILLMFTAGLDTDINEIRRNSVACFIIAMIGMIFPLLGGTVCYYFFFNDGDMLRAIFIGVVLTATSVSITVEALREMGKLEGRAGNAILGAAVIDDIIGIIVLTVVSGMKDESISVTDAAVRVIIFMVIMCALGFFINKNKKVIDSNARKQRITTYVFAACLLVAFASEYFFGVADITGAYLFGLFLSDNVIKDEVEDKIRRPSYLFFSPIFFASIGLKVDVGGLNGEMFLFSLILLAVAVFTKAAGCGLGAGLCGFSGREALQVGVGMVSRGEVALIMAQKGYGAGLMSAELFPPIVLMVIATTVMTPIALKRVM